LEALTVLKETDHQCRDCGTQLAAESWSAGLCPGCLMDLAQVAPSVAADLEATEKPTRLAPEAIAGGDAPTLDMPAGPASTNEATLGYTPAELSSEQPTLDSPTELASDAPAGETLSPGEILGDRYRVRSRLGKGGMGEVWRAFDLKLRVDVALKSLRSELTADERALEALRSEVRLAREVVSPNACRVYDLEELEGQELVSMEYIDGTTLLDVIQSRGPLELSEAREIASQFLAGLEAVHEAGLVHRDMKPENVMLTRAGRVVVMDFGIAKSVAEGQGGLIAGTPAYMPPEQSMGQELDARADVFAAGVMLAEMTAPSGVSEFKNRQTIWKGIHQEAPEVPDTPWSGILTKAVSPNREDRYAGASVLARALEEIALRVEGAEELHPYPGLSAFTSDEAKYFFGRELEIESMWKKLRRPHLLGLIGPSGAGKSSFVRAGLLPVMPEGWRAIVTAPGNRPFQALAQSLAGELSDDSEALQQLLEFEDDAVAVEVATKWRQRHEQGLIVLDQFEELFTQNPTEVQEQFSELLARLALDADIHVLLSMRDDFLFHCSDQPALAPVFSELTPLRAPTGAALRRAVVQPALKCGYRFEDEALVEEILSEVEGERGALPMLAFACSRLWEKRDRDQGLLTREAYEAIGGVAGSLAHHAEATLERIGNDQIPVVRELFRNLVTSQGTRASRSRAELLSVFADRGSDEGAEEVLDTLIDARLLTSYDVPPAEAEESGQTRVEIVHESLLSNWPRLVKWRTQDAEGAQLRDELRQAAELWQKRDRPEDLLWTGTSFKEYELWRERYSGGLSAGEEAFATAMRTKAERRKRQRRMALTGAFVVMLVVLAVVGSLWRQSEVARQTAEREQLRAEAQKLVALAQLELETYPTGALAHATKSLELSDSDGARLLALEALWKGPPRWLMKQDWGGDLWFSPDGERLVQTRLAQGEGSRVRLISSDGSSQLLEQRTDGRGAFILAQHGETDRFATFNPWADGGEKFDVVLWSSREGRALAQRKLDPWSVDPYRLAGLDSERQAIIRLSDDHEVLRVPLDPDRDVEVLGILDVQQAGSPISTHISADASWLAAVSGDGVWVYEIGESGLADPVLLGPHPAVTEVVTEAALRRVVTRDPEGEIRIWKAFDGGQPSILQGPTGNVHLEFSDDGTLLLLTHQTGQSTSEPWAWSIDTELPQFVGRLGERSPGASAGLDPVERQLAYEAPGVVVWWRLGLPVLGEPTTLRNEIETRNIGIRFDPSGRWLVSNPFQSALSFWPLEGPYPIVIPGQSASSLIFDPAGRSLTITSGGEVKTLSLVGESPEQPKLAFSIPDRPYLGRVAMSQGADYLAAAYRDQGPGTSPALITVADGSVEYLPGGFEDQARGIDFSPDGRLLAAAGGQFIAEENQIRVWDVATRQLVAVLDPEARLMWETAVFASSEEVFWVHIGSDLRLWNLATGSDESLYDGYVRGGVQASADRRRVIFGVREPPGNELMLRFLDLDTGETQLLSSHGSNLSDWQIDSTGEFLVTADKVGLIRVGPVTGEEPHLLYGHEGPIGTVRIDPLGRWIASTGADNTLRLWPLPDPLKTPLHKLPHDELITKLKSLTNVRLVEADDAESSTGWKLDLDPFPGWATVPTWYDRKEHR
jgi:WD40 repeat protein